ncbi:AMP-binding protein [Desulfitobacterium hafniense]|uniref:Uncharacterized protein n=1 Tax=Desulfitobacterium hafniense (strain Y51) TaxID=138119 RepID=Q24QW2_DESHY|nr:AMP-binding protein [Desulfitobacterium hafniense]BAE85580.1 hypothetical protein DSY3791 [Desulfitobacterium hafniense Y51]
MPENTQACIEILAEPNGFEFINITMGDLIDAQALRFPLNEFIVEPSTGGRYSYEKFRDECNSLARGLLSIGIKKGDHVALLLRNSFEWILIMFAVAKIGAILVPVNIHLKKNELKYVLQQSDAKAFFTMSNYKDNNYISYVQSICPELDVCETGSLKSRILPKLEKIILVDEAQHPGCYNWNDLKSMADNTSAEDLIRIQKSVHWNDIAFILYTSGTTDNPKGAMHTHYAIINGVKMSSEKRNLSFQDRQCLPLPLFHGLGSYIGVVGCLCKGTTIVLMETAHPVKVMDALEKEKCTSIVGVPTMFINLCDHPNVGNYNFSSLRTGIIAGALCPLDVMKKISDLLHIPELVCGYGLSEFAACLTVSDTTTPYKKRMSTVGYCSPGSSIKIIDPETGKELPPGQVGELLAKGYHMMKGYYNMPEATNEVMTKDGWLKTGDLASVDEDGYYQIVGRKKDMIIRGGENIAPREIEDVITTLPGVKDAQVIGVPDEKYGEEIMAYITLVEGAKLSSEDVQNYVRNNLSSFKVPRYIHFIDQMPMTASGKVQKYVLRMMAFKELNIP